MKPIRVTVSREQFERMADGTFNWWLPLRRCSKWIPKQSFAIGDDDVLIAEKPDEIIFRQRFTFKRVKRRIRVAMLQHSELDGKDDIYIKLYLL